MDPPIPVTSINKSRSQTKKMALGTASMTWYPTHLYISLPSQANPEIDMAQVGDAGDHLASNVRCCT